MSENGSRLITLAIHTFDKAVALRSILENEGIEVVFDNVNLSQPVVSSGIRVRIHETDLPLALRIIENREVFVDVDHHTTATTKRHILVPVDFSESTISVVKTAAKIASRQNLSLHLINSYIDPYVADDSIKLADTLGYDLVDADSRQKISSEAKSQMSKLEKHIRELMKTGEIEAVKFTTSVLEGVPEDIILEEAKINQPVLIVMGTRRAEKKEREMIGSVAAEVLDGSKVPVLTIPQSRSDISDNIKQILFLANADQEDIIAMDSVTRILPDIKAEVTVIDLPSHRRWIPTSRNQSSTELVKYFRNTYKNLKFEHQTIGEQDDSDVISKLDELHHFDIVAMPNKRKRNILTRLFSQSLAHKIIFNTDVALFVIPV